LAVTGPVSENGESRSIRPCLTQTFRSTVARKEFDVTARFLIEVPHEETTLACARAVEVFLKSGSHFLSNADWGCKDGEHKAWMVVEVESKDDARRIVPPAFRSRARIVQLNAFTMTDIEDILRHHEP
jgi:hypothetical protein